MYCLFFPCPEKQTLLLLHGAQVPGPCLLAALVLGAGYVGLGMGCLGVVAGHRPLTVKTCDLSLVIPGGRGQGALMLMFWVARFSVTETSNPNASMQVGLYSLSLAKFPVYSFVLHSLCWFYWLTGVTPPWPLSLMYFCSAPAESLLEEAMVVSVLCCK